MSDQGGLERSEGREEDRSDQPAAVEADADDAAGERMLCSTSERAEAAEADKEVERTPHS